MTVYGGDTVQVLQTKAALEELGLTIELQHEQFPDVRGYDLVHIFNTQFAYFGSKQLAHVKRQGCPVALSTIYWNMLSALQSPDFLRYEIRQDVGTLSRHTPRLSGRLLRDGRDLITGYKKKISGMLTAADVLLPNSVAELEILVHEFGYPQARSKAFIVANAVRPAAPSSTLSEVARAALARLPEKFVMEAARVESVKGQLPMLRSTAKWCPDLPLVFVGGHRPENRYWQEFERLRAQRKNVHYINVLPHEDLPAFYARAKVHALPSFRESPGLSTLEAALCGSNCVVGVESPIQEYFGNDVWVCDPMDEDSIGKAIVAAWNAPARPGLRERVAGFTWERAAHETLAAYNFVMSRQQHA